MRGSVLFLGVLVAVVPMAAARAQNTGGGASPEPSATTTGSAAPSDSGSTAPSARPATGYGYSNHARQGGRLAVHSGSRHAAHHAQAHGPAGPIATLPGFAMLPEGGSRLFVEITQPVQIDEHKSRGKLTYVLHGAHVALRNNENPLVTVHFNTPVSRARLVPVGHDLHFIVDLRAAATPTWKGSAGKDGTFVLTIDFPKGSYISHAESVKRAPRAAILLGASLVASRARADDVGLGQELDVRADEVTVDTRMRELELRGHVHADAPPFHLSSDALKLRRTSHGIVVDGHGRLTFCPCLGTPLALGFESVTVAPPGDLFLTSPRLEIFGVPVFWLPFFGCARPIASASCRPTSRGGAPTGSFSAAGCICRGGSRSST